MSNTPICFASNSRTLYWEVVRPSLSSTTSSGVLSAARQCSRTKLATPGRRSGSKVTWWRTIFYRHGRRRARSRWKATHLRREIRYGLANLFADVVVRVGEQDCGFAVGIRLGHLLQRVPQTPDTIAPVVYEARSVSSRVFIPIGVPEHSNGSSDVPGSSARGVGKARP